MRRLRESRGRARFLDDEERRRLLAACRASWDDRLYPLVLLAISTGARRGELMALRWHDVDLTRRIGILHKTKNGERRAIVFTGEALQILIERSENRHPTSDLIFARTDCRAWFPLRPWKAALRDCGIANFRFHDLRTLSPS